MNAASVHQRARGLILDRQATTLEPVEDLWLDGHLDQCAECRTYADSTDRAVAILQMASETPGSSLVRATQLSVRRAAANLGDRASHRRMLVVSCCLAAAWGAVLQPYLWRLFGWAGAYLALPNPVWQSAFVAMWLVPGIVSVLLLTHLPLPEWIDRGVERGERR